MMVMMMMVILMWCRWSRWNDDRMWWCSWCDVDDLDVLRMIWMWWWCDDNVMRCDREFRCPLVRSRTIMRGSRRHLAVQVRVRSHARRPMPETKPADPLFRWPWSWRASLSQTEWKAVKSMIEWRTEKSGLIGWAFDTWAAQCMIMMMVMMILMWW